MDKAQLYFLLFDGTEDLVPFLNNAVDLALPMEDVFGVKRRPQARKPNEKNESTVLRYTDTQFIDLFRMSKQTFQILLEEISNINKKDDRTIPLEKKLLFSIWLLSTPESFLAATDRFGLSKSTGHQIFNNMINLICQLMAEYIKWPLDHNRTINNFRNLSGGIPGIVGAIDGCHIPIKQPEGNAYDYYNRKQFHSIILQGICNENALFIDVNVGQPGRMHDARVFRLSPIYEKLMDAEEPLISPEKHIIGDSAYPLSINVMKPYPDNGHLSHAEVVFNTKLSSARSIIERAFILLTEKFSRLKYLDVATPETAVRIVGAACVLHNFILMQKNDLDDWDLENVIIKEENEINIGGRVDDARGAAEDKRFSIMNLINENF